MTADKNAPVPSPTSPTLRVVSIDENASNDETPKKNAPSNDAQRAAEPTENADETPEIDDFFAKSFAFDDAGRENDSLDAAFAGGLRSIFASEIETNGDEGESEDGFGDSDAEANANDGAESDAERVRRELDAERRESLDGVLRQNDADFLFETGAKYERSRISEADFERDQRGGARDGKTELSDGAESERRVAISPTSVLEAALFVGDRDGKPLALSKTIELMRNVSETEALEALADLNERYFRNGAPYRIVRDGDGYRLALRPEFDDVAARFSGTKTKEFKLSQLAIDVLALVAYKQPITLDEILEVRNNAGSVLSQLVKRELISLEKRTVDKKKVAVYQTTPRFLKLFHLDSLDDLPIVGDVDFR